MADSGRPTFAIMGSGGMGGYIGAKLNQAGYRVCFIARGGHLEAMKANGLKIEGPEEAFVIDSAQVTNDPADIGPVDLLCRDADGNTVAIEVKRRGEIDGVEQLTRYLDFLNRDPLLRPVHGVLVAQEIRPQARLLAVDRGIGCLVVDYDHLRGIESDVLKLF